MKYYSNFFNNRTRSRICKKVPLIVSVEFHSPWSLKNFLLIVYVEFHSPWIPNNAPLIVFVELHSPWSLLILALVELVVGGSANIPSFLKGFVLRSTGLISNNNLIPAFETMYVLHGPMTICWSHQTNQMN